MDGLKEENLHDIKGLKHYSKPSFLSDELWAKARHSIVIEKLIEYFYSPKNVFGIKASELLSAAEIVFGKSIYEAREAEKFLSQSLKKGHGPKEFFQRAYRLIDGDYRTLEELGVIYNIERLIKEKSSLKEMVEIAESIYFFSDEECPGIEDDLLVNAAQDFLQSDLTDDKGLVGIIIYNIKSGEKREDIKKILTEKVNNYLDNNDALNALIKYSFAGLAISFEDCEKKELELRIAQKIIESNNRELMDFGKKILCYAYEPLRKALPNE